MIDKDTVRQCSTFPGIYLIRNTVNNKYYVGQAINLRNRLKAHLNNSKSERYDNPLYRAVKKYTWEVFEYSMLEILETKDFTKAKKQLDVLETKYIEQYNSYNCGYNQTLGGDGGILGYKMTAEQIQKIKDNHVEPNACSCILYKLDTKEFKEFKSQSEAARFLNCNHSNVYYRCSGERKIPLKGYLIRNTKEEIKQMLSEEFAIENTGQFTFKYTKEEFLQLLEDNPINTKKDIPILGICEKTFYNYLKKYNIKSPFKERTKIDYYCVGDIQSNKYYKFKTAKDLGEFFNISESSARKLARLKKNSSLYKKRFYIYTIPIYSFEEEFGVYGLHYWKNIYSKKIIATNCPNKQLLYRIVNDVNEWIYEK